MPNGAAVRLPLELQPPSPPVPTVTDKPTAGIEASVASAVADAAEAVSMAFSQHVAGETMHPRIKTMGGEALARVAQLRLDLLGEDTFDFEDVARERGKHTLQQRHNRAAIRQQLGVTETELNGVFAELIQHVLAISQKVVRDELALAKTWAN